MSVVPRLRRKLGKRQEPKRSQAIVDGDDHGALASELVAQLIRIGAGAVLETPSIDPEHHRQVLTRRFLRRPDVQIQAVLAHGLIVGAPGAARTHLRAAQFECVGLEDARPGLWRLRRTPSQLPDRRRGERQSLVNSDTALLNALHEPLLRVHECASRRSVDRRSTYQQEDRSQLHRQLSPCPRAAYR